MPHGQVAATRSFRSVNHSRDAEKFFRVPGTRGAGAGLGLSICREIVEVHGGEIGVDEASGGGAIFWFTFPASESDSQEGGPTMPAAR
jgi:K+-sensing histidine kinase KdpD